MSNRLRDEFQRLVDGERSVKDICGNKAHEQRVEEHEILCNRVDEGMAQYREAKEIEARGKTLQEYADALCDDPPSALHTQIGGDHYSKGTIQPFQYIEANSLQFAEGCVVKRVTRHDKPSGKGVEDINKAIHELQLLKELRYGQ